MGLSEYLLTITTVYFATPENEWASLIGAHVPPWVVHRRYGHSVVLRGQTKDTPLWQPWVEPLCYWVLFAEPSIWS